VPDDGVTAAVAEAIRAAGREYVADPPALPFATDFGAVSRRVPSALIGIGRPGGWAFHTPLGEEQFASEDGVEMALAMAEVLALAASRLSAPR
jgi:metal-dependent amidase/aminoacylase/carboxypeptidase family protein